MSNIVTIEQFFVSKEFVIPAYQRDYSWKLDNIEDMLNDISEAVDTQSGHYLGTVVLANLQQGKNKFEVVDGQQRLTTLTLIFDAFLKQLEVDDITRITNLHNLVMNEDKKLKLDFGLNFIFASDMLANKKPTPTTPGQRRLQENYQYALERATALKNISSTSEIKRWITTIKKLELISFEALTTGNAIRMFQTVNDRGLPLSTMDKVKALLIYYSNRYLNGELDDEVNKKFGECFFAFDSLKNQAKKVNSKIENIARDNFTEDDLLRYHYLAYYNDKASGIEDYEGSLKAVFDTFIKQTLISLRDNRESLKSFIENYVSDLSSFCEAFKNLVIQVENNVRFYKLFVILGLSARLYPLVIRLYQREILTNTISDKNYDLLHLIEVCDVRVYKTRNTNPLRDLGVISHSSQLQTVEVIASQLNLFIKNFMDDGLFKIHLSGDMYHNNAFSHMLINYEESISGEKTIEELKGLVNEIISTEHILSQEPVDGFGTYNFDSNEDYQKYNHTFGNLTLLTRSENARCNNQAVNTKMTDNRLYSASVYASTRNLAQIYHISNNSFKKENVLKRTDELIEFTVNRWNL